MIHLGHLRMLRLSGAFFAARKALTEDGLRATWRAVDAVKAAAEKPVARAYARILERQEAAVLKAWARVGPGQVDAARQSDSTLKVVEDWFIHGEDFFTHGDRGPWRGILGEPDDPPAVKRTDPRAATLGGLVFDPAEWLGLVDEAMRPLLLDAIAEGFASGALRIGRDLPFRLTPRAEAELERVVGLVKDANETTRDSIGRVIRDGMTRRRTVDEIAGDLKATFSDWQEWRAKLVAQTSTTNVFEVGQQEAWAEAEIGRNRWLSMRDDRVRAEHADMDGEEVNVGEAFSNGLVHPSEPNCRCTLLPVLGPEEKAAPEVKGRPSTRVRNARLKARWKALKAEGHPSPMAMQLVLEEYHAENPHDLIGLRTVTRACHGG